MSGRRVEKVTAVACALILAVGVMRGTVLAKAEEPSDEIADPEATFVVVDLDTVSPVDASSGETEVTAASDTEAETFRLEVTDNRDSVPLFVNGTEAGACPVIGGIPYVSAELLFRALGMDFDARYEGDCFTVTGDIDLQAKADDIYFVCCGRYLYVEDGVRFRDGQALFPVALLAKCLNVSVEWERVLWTVSVTADRVVPLESGSTYYDETDVYWLSRVIYAESGSQSLLGQIAVGSVVLNRVENDEFPGQDDVYSVIFAKNQFEVVINGMIYMQPDETAVTAAKLALEGADVTDGSTYFATFDFGEGYECVMWIEDHCFMREA